MTEISIVFTGLSIFSAVFTFGTSLLMFYLRSIGSAQGTTKSQRWALTILAWLFFLNGICIITDTILTLYSGRSDYVRMFAAFTLLRTGRIVTAVFLLTFGLVYPRPFTSWEKLRPILVLLMILSVLLIAWDIMNGRRQYWGLERGLFDPLAFIYIPAVFIPVHIWISQYSRQPSADGRMMYTILIWGFLFNVVDERTVTFLRAAHYPVYVDELVLTYVVLLSLTLLRLGLVLWDQRKRWALSETFHIVLLLMAVTIGVTMGQGMIKGTALGEAAGPVMYFFTVSFGWMLVRPALFSYGLLRYRLLGTKLKAERFLAVLGAFLISTVAFFVVISSGTGLDVGGDPATWGVELVTMAFVVAAIALLLGWFVSQRIVTRLLPMSAGARTVSMKERRNTYFMALQTAVVLGRIGDEEDKDSLGSLRKELGISDREHDLLMETIAIHDVRRLRTNEVEEAYLILRDGRLITYFEAGHEREEMLDEDSMKEVVASMLTAVGSFVSEAMGRDGAKEVMEEVTGVKEAPGAGDGEGEGGGADGMKRASMDAVSYGSSTLVIEMEGKLILAIVLNGQDDPSIRQAMRDTLAEVNETYVRISGGKWDGDRRGLEGIWSSLKTMAEHIRTGQT